MSYVTRSVVGPENIDATDEGVLFGLAIPYNKVTTIGDLAHGGFREQIAPGACSKSLRESDIVALWNHSSEMPLGRTSAGNLDLKNTTRGVEPTLRPVPTSYAKDLADLVKAKVVRGWSFGFEVVKDDWTDDDGKPSNEWVGTNRTIREMKLIEVSPVTFPAYEMTDISSRDSLLREREIRAGKMTTQRTDIPAAMSLSTDAASLLVSIYNALLPEQIEALPDELREALVAVKRGGNAPGDGSKPYGDVPYADPGYQKDGKKRYPIDTAAHAKAAWSYINKAGNASAYSAEQLASIKGKIKAACKKFGIDISEDNAAQFAAEWRVKRYDPETGEARKAGRRARCTRCGSRMSCPKCDIDPKEGNDTPEGGKPDADDDTHEPADKTTDKQGRSAATKALKRAKRATKLAKRARKLAKRAKRDHGKSDNLSSGTSKRVPQIAAALNSALQILGAADLKSLPPDVQQAIALVSSAATHANHIMEHEDLSPADAISANDKKGRSVRTSDDPSDTISCPACGASLGSDDDYCPECGEMVGGQDIELDAKKTSAQEKRSPKPDKTTSETVPDDDALRALHFEALSREFALGL